MDIACPSIPSDYTRTASHIAVALQDHRSRQFVPCTKEIVTDTAVTAKPSLEKPRSTSREEMQPLLANAVTKLDSWAPGMFSLIAYVYYSFKRSLDYIKKQSFDESKI